MGKFSEYKLPLKSLPVGSHKFEYHIGKQFFTNIEDNDVRNADVDVALTVEHRNGCYSLRFKVTGEVVVACDRCLDDLPLPVETAYDIVVKYGEDYSDDSDDFLVIPESDSYLNVAYMIHDTIALAIPIKHVHPSGKCNKAMSALLKKHRSEETGEPADPDLADIDDILDDGDTEAQADPRWDKLKNLKIETTENQFDK